MLHSLWELALDPADVLLEHLPVPDLLLHVAGLARVAAEHEQPRGEPVQTVDGAQVLQVVLLGQDEHHGVVAVPPAGVHLEEGAKELLAALGLRHCPDHS